MLKCSISGLLFIYAAYQTSHFGRTIVRDGGALLLVYVRTSAYRTEGRFFLEGLKQKKDFFLSASDD